MKTKIYHLIIVNMETNIYKKLFEVKKAWIKLQRDTKAFNYKYATLSQIQEKLWDILEKQNLMVVHYIMWNELVTTIRDVEWDDAIESRIPLTEWIKAQDKWSEITYYRRYNLLSLLDLEVEDDDWKKAQGSKWKTNYAKKDNNEVELPRFEDKTLANLQELINGGEVITMWDIRKKYKIAKRYNDDLAEIGII